jgi:DHA1 family bicyclomycin/chloramphenicol resistance-like MFS transporter
MGTLSDRFGRRPVLIAGFIIAVASNFGALVSNHIGQLIAARLVQSFGASTGLAVGRAIIRDLYSRDRAAAMLGVVTSVTILSPMIAPVLGGVLDTALGWRSIFAVLCLGSAAVLLYVLLALPETRPERHGGGFVLVAELKLLARSRKFLGYVLTLAFGAVPFFTFVGGAPHVIVSVMHYSSAAYGIGFAVVCVTFLGGTTLTARFAGRVGVDRLIGYGLACIVTGSVFAVVGTLFFAHLGPASIFVPQMLMSFGNGMFMPNSVAGAISVPPAPCRCL